MNNIIEQLNDIILEAKIVGMAMQEDKFGYAETNDLDKLTIQFLQTLGIQNVSVLNGYIY